jgi:hypothetical protein
VFDTALEKLEEVFWLELGEEVDDLLGVRATRAEQTLEQLILIWRRAGQDRLAELAAYAHMSALVARRREEGVHSPSSETDQEYRELTAADHEAQTALWVDWKSFFIFGELLLGDFALLSEVIWNAPGTVTHDDGITRFWRTAEEVDVEPGSAFGVCMGRLLQRIKIADSLVGFYRDKFIMHLPADMTPGSGGSLDEPHDFYLSHQRHHALAEGELERLREAVDPIAAAVGLHPRASDSQVPICGVDGDRRSGCGYRPRFLSTLASAPLESWLAGVDERAALVRGVESRE